MDCRKRTSYSNLVSLKCATVSPSRVSTLDSDFLYLVDSMKKFGFLLGKKELMVSLRETLAHASIYFVPTF